MSPSGNFYAKKPRCTNRFVWVEKKTITYCLTHAAIASIYYNKISNPLNRPPPETAQKYDLIRISSDASLYHIDLCPPRQKILVFISELDTVFDLFCCH